LPRGGARIVCIKDTGSNVVGTTKGVLTAAPNGGSGTRCRIRRTSFHYSHQKCHQGHAKGANRTEKTKMGSGVPGKMGGNRGKDKAQCEREEIQ